MTERRSCVSSNGNCKAPAGYGIPGVGWADGDGTCRTKCWHCHEPVCTDPLCSKVIMTPWGDGRKRCCADCIDELTEVRRMRALASAPRVLMVPHDVKKGAI